MKNLIVLLFLTVSIPSFAQITYQNKTMKVTGSAKLLIQPDEIYLNLILTEVNKRDKKVNISQARSEFYKACNELQIHKENITVSDMRFDAIKQRMSFWRNKVRVFTKQERYEVKFNNLVELEKFVKRMEQDYVQSISIGKITHSELTNFREQVKMDAMKAAKHKAEYLTKAIGQKVGPAIYIEEVSTSPYMNYTNFNRSALSNVSSRYRGEEIKPQNIRTDMKPIELRYEIMAIFELK